MTQIGLAMVTVNQTFCSGWGRTLMEIARTGIKGVEWKTFFGYDAKELRRALDLYGLISVASHERRQCLRDYEQRKRMVEFQKILGTRYIVYTMGAVDTPRETKALIEELNEVGRCLREDGLELLYHNHAEEYKIRNGRYVMDEILAGVEEENANLELDVLYLNGVHRIPVRPYMLSQSRRIRMIHAKDGYVDFARTDKQAEMMYGIPLPAGEGIVDLSATVQTAGELGIEWLMIENEEPEADVWQEVHTSLTRLSAMLP